jgi:hypothetical protein
LINVSTAYEAKMFPRGAKSAKGSATGLDTMFNDTSPRKLVAFFRPMIFARVLAPFERLFRGRR